MYQLRIIWCVAILLRVLQNGKREIERFPIFVKIGSEGKTLGDVRVDVFIINGKYAAKVKNERILLYLESVCSRI